MWLPDYFYDWISKNCMMAKGVATEIVISHAPEELVLLLPGHSLTDEMLFALLLVIPKST